MAARNGSGGKQPALVVEANRRRHREAEPRRHAALALRLQGKSYKDIADELGMGIKTAHKLVQQALKRISERTNEKATELVRLEAERLDKLISLAWVQAETGDLRAIEVVEKLSASRRKLFGLDTPTTQRLEHTGAGGLPLGLPPQLALLQPPPSVQEVAHFAEVPPDRCFEDGCRVHGRPALPEASEHGGEGDYVVDESDPTEGT